MLVRVTLYMSRHWVHVAEKIIDEERKSESIMFFLCLETKVTKFKIG